MARSKIIFFGFSMAGAEVLRELISGGANVAAVYTYEDNPAENWFESVKKIAVENKIPVFTPEKIERADIENIGRIGPEIILSVYYRSLLPDEILKLAPRGAYNIHGSYLPKYSGRAPVTWVLVNGEKYTGATLHYMVAKADAGDIVDQEKVEIKFEDDAFTLTKKVSAAARAVIKRSLKKLENWPAEGAPQTMAQSTYFGRRTPEDGRIDWSWDEIKIYNLIRAVTKPFPGAFAEAEGKKILIWKAKPLDKKSGAPAGTIISRKPFIVATGGKDLEILEFE
ncbi:MAG: formyltransferase [Elusimicrobium sp.]|jgi:methionyl-tRNA formyltransferase|nr:formyltransferase [Elusimicrobium sp.]